MTILLDIEATIIGGFESLSDSISNHWPLPENDYLNEISEANITLYVANAFLNSKNIGKCYAFSEYRINGNQHLDMKIVPANKEYEIIGECKRFLKTDGTALSHDIDRMVKIRPSEAKILFGMVLVMTWHSSIGEWWQDKNRREFPSKRHKANEWSRLYKLMEKHKFTCGSVSLGNKSEYYKGLYGIFKILP